MPYTLSEQESSTQAKDSDIPLSEGFHWESLPDSPSGTDWTGPPLPPQHATHDHSRMGTRSDSQMREPPERPGPAREGRSRQPVETVPMKVESNPEDENGDNSSANKRKHTAVVVSTVLLSVGHR